MAASKGGGRAGKALRKKTPLVNNSLVEPLLLRRAKALQLRLDGEPYESIAATLGVDTMTAYNDVVQALRLSIKEKAEEVLDVELKRLDKLHASLWREFNAGNLDLSDRILRVAERRSKLLGLDAAIRVDHKVEVDVSKFIAEAIQVEAKEVITIEPSDPDEEQ
jgi:hypothetical protein